MYLSTGAGVRGRAYRRAQRERAEAYAYQVIYNIWKDYSSYWKQRNPEWRRELALRVNLMATTMKPCSCRGCGHVRLYEGPTEQERRQPSVGELLREEIA